MAGDPYWNNVVLAMHMDGANASTVFTDLKGHVLTAAGNAQISTAQSKFGAASALFDGTGDYLSSPVAADLTFGSGAFTIECFVRPGSAAAAGGILAMGTGNNQAMIYSNAGNLLFYASSDGVSWGVASGVVIKTAYTVGQWYHIAVCRLGGSIYLFLDGALANTVTLSESLALTAPVTSIFIGAQNTTAASLLGHIDDLRITKGVARYTANFTPPTLAFPDAPAMISGTVKDTTGTLGPRAVRVHRKSDGALSGATTSHSTTGAFAVPALDASPHYAIVHDSDADPYWPNVVLATHFDTDSVIDPHMSSVVLGLHMEGANASTVFQDVTGKTVTAVGNAQISTDTTRFGNTSAKFDGTGDYLTIPDNTAFQMGANDFTVEVWVCLTALPAASTTAFVVDRYSGTARSWALNLYNAAGTINLYFNCSLDGVSNIAAGGVWAPALNTWYHVAGVRSGTATTVYVNGAAVGASGSVSGSLFVGSNPVVIGANADLSGTLTGYLDDVRITNGVARYTSAFTPPTAPFSSFKDLTGKDLMVNGVLTISAAMKKYGDGALSLTGVYPENTHISVADSIDWHWPGAYTVEMWLNPTSYPGTAAYILQQGQTPGGVFCPVRIDMTPSGAITILGSDTNLAWLFSSGFLSATTLPLATWTHFALCDDGRTATLYINGVAESVRTTWTKLDSSMSLLLGGAYAGADRLFKGFIDDLRVTKGAARYQTNFTPPERAFPSAMGASIANALIYDDLTPV